MISLVVGNREFVGMVDIEERTVEDDQEKVVEGSVQAIVDGDHHEGQVGHVGRL